MRTGRRLQTTSWRTLGRAQFRTLFTRTSRTRSRGLSRPCFDPQRRLALLFALHALETRSKAMSAHELVEDWRGALAAASSLGDVPETCVTNTNSDDERLLHPSNGRRTFSEGHRPLAPTCDEDTDGVVEDDCLPVELEASSACNTGGQAVDLALTGLPAARLPVVVLESVPSQKNLYANAVPTPHPDIHTRTHA